MDVKIWLGLVAHKTKKDYGLGGEESEIYESDFDNSYIAHVGMEDHVKHLADRGITEQLTHGVGFSPKDGKWYGWSHRAIYGFEVGSTCSEGDCHYTAPTPEALIESHVRFYAGISKERGEEARAECQILDDRSGIRILPAPVVIPVLRDINDLPAALESAIDLPEEDVFKDSFHEIKCGKGEWTAKTLEDAKQMAVDFNEGVS